MNIYVLLQAVFALNMQEYTQNLADRFIINNESLYSCGPLIEHDFRNDHGKKSSIIGPSK